MTQADHSYYTDRHVERYHQEILNFQCVTQLDVLNSCISIKSIFIFNKIITTSTYPLRW